MKLASYRVTETTPYAVARVGGMAVLYEHEAADRSVGVCEQWTVIAVEIGDHWISTDALAREFLAAIEDALPRAVQSRALERRADLRISDYIESHSDTMAGALGVGA